MIIKLLEYMEEKYLYDANCNRIVKITDELYTELKRNEKLSETLEGNGKVKEELESLISKGYLKDCFPKKIEHPYTPFITE
mgnify:CR=1 FL=1